MPVKPETQTKAELRAERDHWKKLAEEGLEPRIRSMRFDDGGFNMEVIGPLVEQIAVAFVGQFKAGGATNYTEMSLYDRDEPYQRYVFTVQKSGKLSPHKVAVLTEGLTHIAGMDRSLFASEEPINVARTALAKIDPPPEPTPTKSEMKL